VSARKVFYDTDTMGGQSGSAVYRIINGGRFAVAVHAYGGATANSGTRINADVVALLTQADGSFVLSAPVAGQYTLRCSSDTGAQVTPDVAVGSRGARVIVRLG